jgi:serine protease AprX
MAETRVPVMIEIGVAEDAPPEAILRIAEEWQSFGFRLDRGYVPVRIRPREEERERLAAAKIQVVIVRGSLDPKQVPTIERNQSVRKVWLDTKLDPHAPPTARRPKRHARRSPPSRSGKRPPRPRKPHPKLPKPPKSLVRRPARRVVVKPDCEDNSKGLGDLDPTVVKYLKVNKIHTAGFKGAGIVVGVVDGGMTAIGRPIQANEVAKIPNVVDGWPDNTANSPVKWGTSAAGWDQHGNMTAYDVLGVAPDASLWDLRIYETVNPDPVLNFAALLSNALAAYRKAIDSHRAAGVPHILSNSWGLWNRANGLDFATNPQSPFALTVEEALDEGILVLFSAGNCGGGCPFFAQCGPADRGPGNSILGPNGHPRVMTVGAANKNGKWLGITSQGPAVLPPNAPKPDFCSIAHFNGYFPGQAFPNPSGNPVRDFDGSTSAATAVAAGVVALLLQKRKNKGGNLTQDEAKQALMDTAKDIRARGFDRDSGAGIIQAKAAFDTL